MYINTTFLSYQTHQLPINFPSTAQVVLLLDLSLSTNLARKEDQF